MSRGVIIMVVIGVLTASYDWYQIICLMTRDYGARNPPKVFDRNSALTVSRTLDLQLAREAFYRPPPSRHVATAYIK